MNIRIGNLVVTSFCSDNIEHIRFRKELVNDNLFHHFLPNLNERNLFKVVSDTDDIRTRYSYIIKDNDKLVGWVYIGGDNKILNFDYAVHPAYRHLGYGSIILDEFSSYLFKNNLANEIEYVVNENNTACINCIKKTKAKKIGKMSKYHIYRLSRD